MSYLLAITAGILSFLSYPRFDWWPLIFVAQAPLILSLKELSPGKRFLHGWLSGAVFICGMQYWVAGTMVSMSHFPWWLAIVCLLIYSAYVGAQWGVFALLFEPVRRWSGPRGWVLTIPLLYVLIEKYYPALFPFPLASALFEVPALLQTSTWFGMAGPSWMIMLTTCACVHGIEQSRKRRHSEYFVPAMAIAMWLVVSVMGITLMGQIWNAPVTDSTTVALIQPNVTIAEKNDRRRQTRERVFERTTQMTQETMAIQPDLVVWPEGGFPFRFIHDAPQSPQRHKENRNTRYTRKLYRFALNLGVDFAAGSLRRVGDRTRNSVIFFPRGGDKPTIYDKRNLLLFGERVPFADTFPELRERIPGMSHHEAGDTFTIFDAAGHEWSASLCYEAIFARFIRDGLTRENNQRVLLNFTNDVWFGDTSAAEQHLMLQIPRSIENRTWLVRGTNSGISAFVDPAGVIQARTRVGEQTTLAHEIHHYSLAPSFYRKYGDIFLYLALALAAIILIFNNRKQVGNILTR